MIYFNYKDFFNDCYYHQIKNIPYKHGRPISESTYDRWYNKHKLPIMAFFDICLILRLDMSNYWKADHPDTSRKLKIKLLHERPNINLKMMIYDLKYHGYKADDLKRAGISKSMYNHLDKCDYSKVWIKDIENWMNRFHLYLGDFIYPGYNAGLMPFDKDTTFLGELMENTDRTFNS